MKIHQGAVWVSNSDRGTIVRVPLTGVAGRVAARSGPPGRPASTSPGAAPIRAAVNEASELVRVSSDGTVTTLLDAADGLQGTTAVVVRGRWVDFTNGANIEGNDPTLMRAHLCN